MLFDDVDVVVVVAVCCLLSFLFADVVVVVVGTVCCLPSLLLDDVDDVDAAIYRLFCCIKRVGGHH